MANYWQARQFFADLDDLILWDFTCKQGISNKPEFTMVNNTRYPTDNTFSNQFGYYLQNIRSIPALTIQKSKGLLIDV